MPNKKVTDKTDKKKDTPQQEEDRYTARERAADFKKYEQLKRKNK